jgi:hypothetical protein
MSRDQLQLLRHHQKEMTRLYDGLNALATTRWCNTPPSSLQSNITCHFLFCRTLLATNQPSGPITHVYVPRGSGASMIAFSTS